MMTVHKSKGKQADYVILLDVIDDMYGFPAQVFDDDVINLILLASETIPYAEEEGCFMLQ